MCALNERVPAAGECIKCGEAVVILGVERTVNDGEDACGCIDRHDCSSATGFFAVGDENWVAGVMCNVKAEHVTRHVSPASQTSKRLTRSQMLKRNSSMPESDV